MPRGTVSSSAEIQTDLATRFRQDIVQLTPLTLGSSTWPPNYRDLSPETVVELAHPNRLSGRMREPSADRRWHANFYVQCDAARLHMERLKSLTLTMLLPSLIALTGCEDLVPHDTQSLLDPNLRRSEVVGLVAGFGTTFAAMPDLIAMLKRRSSAGMNPRMATIMGVSQILWVYYGLLIASRPVVIWNVIAVLVNSLSVGANFHFVHKERAQH